MENKTTSNGYPTKLLVHDLAVIVFWIGLWGLIEALIDLFVPENSIAARAIIYIIIIAVAVYLLFR